MDDLTVFLEMGAAGDLHIYIQDYYISEEELQLITSVPASHKYKFTINISVLKDGDYCSYDQRNGLSFILDKYPLNWENILIRCILHKHHVYEEDIDKCSSCLVESVHDS